MTIAPSPVRSTVNCSTLTNRISPGDLGDAAEEGIGVDGSPPAWRCTNPVARKPRTAATSRRAIAAASRFGEVDQLLAIAHAGGYYHRPIGPAEAGHYRFSRISSKNLTRARVVRLAEPEHRLLAHFGVAVGARDLHQLRHAFVLRQLAEREDRLLLHLGVRIVVDRVGDGRRSPPCRPSAPARTAPGRGPWCSCRRARSRSAWSAPPATLLTERPKVAFSRTLSLGSCAIMRASRRAPGLAARAAEPERGVAAQPLRARRRDEALERAVGGRRRCAARSALIAVLPTRSCRSPDVRRRGDQRRQPGDALVGLDVGQPDQRHRGRVDVAVGRERAHAA